ncbi:MAG: terminase family protein [candidate division NC10 bacterium]
MDRSAREMVLDFPEEDLALLTGEELAIYERALSLHNDMMTPLDHAVAVSKARRFTHAELLNRWLMALMGGRLYFDGPGPVPITLTRDMTAPETTTMLVAGYGGDEIPYMIPEDQHEFLEALPEGVAYDEDGFLILVHPERLDRPVYNIAISMPPRHGKSYLVSEHFPAWFLSNYPEYSVLLASYEATFAAEWGGKVRDHIVEHPEFGIEVTGGRNASRGNFDLEGHRGFMKCAGAGGPLTGKGGHVMICDDPIKNAQDALSEVERQINDDWWKTTFFTRREVWDDGTPGRVILMSTRWHEDDLHGRRIPKIPELGSRWAQMNLMAIFEPTADEPVDPIGRLEGQALCPARMPLRELRDLRDEESMGEAWFQAMYQGHPSLEEGNIIKRPFSYFTATTENGKTTYELQSESGDVEYVEADECYRFATLDLAASDRKHADWTVMLVFDVTPGTNRRLLVVGMERIRITTEHHEEHVIEWYKKWGLRMLAIENKTYGTNLLGRLKRISQMILRKLSGDQIPLVRVMPVQYEIRNGNVFFPAAASWLTEFEAEIVKFPKAKHDDMVDCLAYGVQVYQDMPAQILKQRDPVTIEEKLREELKNLTGRGRSRRRSYPVIGQW